MSVLSLCKPRPSVFAADRRATVLSLDTFLKGQVNGPEFFEENYFTNGMSTLVDRAFRHLGGAGAGSSVFLLSQAMGGGKTHSMIALGLLARDPELRKKALGVQDPAPGLGRCRVAGFNGRSTDAAGGIWGSLADQLGKAEQFARYVSPLLGAPGPEAWKQLLDGDPLVIVRPGGQANQLPISADWQEWWNQQQYKNRVLFLTGSRDTFQKVLDTARQTRALQSIEDELKSESTPSDDPQWRALDALRDRVGLQFTAALKEAFDQIVYPSINSALRTTGTDLAFAGNQSGEATLRHTLEGAQKFTTRIDDESFRSRAEARLFGSPETKVVLWSDFKRAAAVNTNWPLHKISALDDLKADCFRRGLWREEGNHVRRGPFAPPVPEVSIRELSRQEDGAGITYLKIEPLHAPSVVYETGDSDPTCASSPVPTPTRFEAVGLRYRFLAFDPADLLRISEVEEWTAKLRLKYQLHNRGDHYEVELLALPKVGGIAIRYTTDGSSPASVGVAVYDGAFRVPAKCRVVCAMAVSSNYNLNSELIRIPIPQPGSDTRPPIDPTLPARWNQQTKIDDSTAVWDFIRRLEKAEGVSVYDISLTAESGDRHQNVEYSGALAGGYDAAALKSVTGKLQEIVGGGSLRLGIGSPGFPTGQALLDWLKATNQPFNVAKVSQ